MTTPRRELAAVASGGYVYALGGEEYNGHALSSVERAAIEVDGSLGPWQTVTPMTGSRYHLAAVSSGGYIYAIGGYAGGGNGLGSVERAVLNRDGSRGRWQTTASLTTPRYAAAVVSAGGYVYTLGGLKANSVALSSVERAAINPDGSLDPWQATIPMTTPRYGLAAVSGAGYVYVLGGRNNSSGDRDSVERTLICPDGSLGLCQ